MEHFIRKSPLNSEPYIALADLHVDSYHFVRSLTLINEVFYLIGNKNKLQVLRERMFFIWLCFLSLGGQRARLFPYDCGLRLLKLRTEINKGSSDDGSILPFGVISKKNRKN